MLTGIGGQGVQLAARIVANAAVLEGREVMMFGVYGGSMRGGNTDATLVVADEPILSPPVVSRAWSAIAMHHEFWPPVQARLRPGAVVLVNATLFEGSLDRSAQRVIEVPASDLATQLGAPLAASLVMIGAYAAATGLVGAGRRGDPSQPELNAVAKNDGIAVKALQAGFEAVPAGAAPAWTEAGCAA